MLCLLGLAIIIELGFVAYFGYAFIFFIVNGLLMEVDFYAIILFSSLIVLIILVYSFIYLLKNNSIFDGSKSERIITKKQSKIEKLQKEIDNLKNSD